MDSLDKAYILIVDDNPKSLTAIGSVLKEFEHLLFLPHLPGKPYGMSFNIILQ
jgi:hypothetical protein